MSEVVEIPDSRLFVPVRAEWTVVDGAVTDWNWVAESLRFDVEGGRDKAEDWESEIRGTAFLSTERSKSVWILLTSHLMSNRPTSKLLNS